MTALRTAALVETCKIGALAILSVRFSVQVYDFMNL